MALDDNWGAFEVKYRDPAQSLEQVEAKVNQLEKTQEDVIEKGTKMRELVDKCNVNNKMRLDAMEKQQKRMQKFGVRIAIAAGVLAFLQVSSVVFVRVKDWYLKKLDAEQALPAAKHGKMSPGSRKSRYTQRSMNGRKISCSTMAD